MSRSGSGHISSGGPSSSGGGLTLVNALSGFFFPVNVQMPTQATIATSITAANVLRVMQFVLPFGITVRKVTCRNGATISAGGKFACGLYDITSKLTLDSGPFSESVASTIQTNTLAIPVVVPAGTYYYVYTADNTTGNMVGLSYDNAVTGPMLRADSPRLGTAANAWNGVSLPATLGVITSTEIISILLAVMEA